MGQDEADFEEVQEWIGHFKSFKPALESKYLNMLSTHHLAESFGYDTPMPQASQVPKFTSRFGINSINNIISQMPDQPVLNIQCQSQAEIKDAITLLFH